MRYSSTINLSLVHNETAKYTAEMYGNLKMCSKWPVTCLSEPNILFNMTTFVQPDY